MKIRIGILGYGNLGRGVECAIKQNPDMELVCVISRRDPSKLEIKSNVPVIHETEVESWRDKINDKIIMIFPP